MRWRRWASRCRRTCPRSSSEPGAPTTRAPGARGASALAATAGAPGARGMSALAATASAPGALPARALAATAAPDSGRTATGRDPGTPGSRPVAPLARCRSGGSASSDVAQPVDRERGTVQGSRSGDEVAARQADLEDPEGRPVPVPDAAALAAAVGDPDGRVGLRPVGGERGLLVVHRRRLADHLGGVAAADGACAALARDAALAGGVVLDLHPELVGRPDEGGGRGDRVTGADLQRRERLLGAGEDLAPGEDPCLAADAVGLDAFLLDRLAGEAVEPDPVRGESEGGAGAVHDRHVERGPDLAELAPVDGVA